MRTLNKEKTEVSIFSDLTEEESRFRERTRKFALNYVTPLVFKMDEEARLDTGLIEKLFEQGLMSIEIPTEYGGRNGSFFNTVLAIEELGIVDPAVSVFVDVQNTLVINALLRWGNEEQKRKYVSMLAKKCVGAFSISETEAGSDTSAISLEATKVHGGYLLNGNKHWATNAYEADIFVIFGNSLSSNGDGKKLTAFILNKKEVEGFTVKRPDEKMGIRASSTCDLVLDKVFIPEENVLGSIGRGQTIALETLTDGRIGISAQMLGLAQGAFNAAVDYAQTRKQFGQFISSFQGIHFPLAQIATEIEAARLLVYKAARLKTVEGSFKELFILSSMAKLYASQVAEKAVALGLEVFGGKGYMKGNVLEKLYRDAKIGKIYEGTSNIQLRIIARKFINKL